MAVAVRASEGKPLSPPEQLTINLTQLRSLVLGSQEEGLVELTLHYSAEGFLPVTVERFPYGGGFELLLERSPWLGDQERLVAVLASPEESFRFEATEVWCRRAPR
jgi:hypothetical protein